MHVSDWCGAIVLYGARSANGIRRHFAALQNLIAGADIE
jgi:hypothetical protein